MVKEIEIPEGYEAKIEDNKVIFVQKESEDERIRKELIEFIQWSEDRGTTRHDFHQAKRPAEWIAYLEKQKDVSKAIEAVDRIDKYIDEHLANAHDMKDSNPDKKYYRGWDDALGKMAGILQDVYSGEKQKDERELGYIEGKVEGVRQTCQEIKDAMSLFEPKDLTPFEFTFRDYIDSAIRYCLSGEGYQQYIKEWSADLLNLEKQKEQKPAECNPDSALQKIKRTITDCKKLSEHYKDTEENFYQYYGGKAEGLQLALTFLGNENEQSQSEQKPAESKSHLTVQGKGVYKICPHCKERMIRDDSKVYTSMPPKYGYNCPKCGAMEFDIVKYDNPETEEQKPAEWSEDEKIRNELLKEIEFISPRDGETDSEGLILPSYRARIDKYRTYLEKQKEQKPAVEQLDGTFNSYDMAKTFVEGQYYVMEHPERFGLCKPVEWSDEDKRMIDNIIYCLPGMATGTIEMLPSLAKQYALRLKSLFPSWKPSEQEKDALRTAIHILTEERNFPKTVAQLQNILNAFEGKESRKDWKPSEDEERLIKTSISFLKDFADKGYENAVECIDWLKSKLNGDACK